MTKPVVHIGHVLEGVKFKIRSYFKANIGKKIFQEII